MIFKYNNIKHLEKKLVLNFLFYHIYLYILSLIDIFKLMILFIILKISILIIQKKFI